MNPESTFFISDLHLFHKNILQYRPFNDIDEMHQNIIEQWNQKVSKKGSVIYHLGDLSFKKGNQDELYEILNQLNGNIICLRGNHDHQKMWNRHTRENNQYDGKLLYENFEFDYSPYREIKVNHQLIVLCHYPIASWNKQNYGSWHLHGHSHGNLDLGLDNMMDVGYDPLVNRGIQVPISFEEVKGIFNNS